MTKEEEATILNGVIIEYKGEYLSPKTMHKIIRAVFKLSVYQYYDLVKEDRKSKFSIWNISTISISWPIYEMWHSNLLSMNALAYFIFSKENVRKQIFLSFSVKQVNFIEDRRLKDISVQQK